ncbi:hypothetical protein [Desulfonatronospira sp.]|uniref:hypothetical protein n=1 Tax=Desulfonatronospira sp. TaxID=1962951 RepID=UPI0025BF90C2|nr:hypothetical protein [Desulfonatronospira sp.]
MQTWKFSIKPDSDEGFDPFLKCKALGMVGIGWSHGYEEKQPKDFEEAKELIKKEWDTSDIPKQIYKLFDEIKPGDHLWMQKYGHYYLCIAGKKKYIAREICEDFRRYDLGHTIEATWIEVPDDLVCGSIQRGTIAQRMIQRINLSEAEVRLNRHIAANLSTNPSWLPSIDIEAVGSVLDTTDQKSLFGLLSPDDVEDIVASKLQTEGWVLIKSTCFRSKPQFEFSMINSDGETGLVQVKSGRWPSPLNPADYEEYLRGNNKIFLFSAHPEPYQGERTENIICLAKSELIEWMKKHSNLLTPTVKLKLSLQNG